LVGLQNHQTDEDTEQQADQLDLLNLLPPGVLGLLRLILGQVRFNLLLDPFQVLSRFLVEFDLDVVVSVLHVLLDNGDLLLLNRLVRQGPLNDLTFLVHSLHFGFFDGKNSFLR